MVDGKENGKAKDDIFREKMSSLIAVKPIPGQSLHRLL